MKSEKKIPVPQLVDEGDGSPQPYRDMADSQEVNDWFPRVYAELRRLASSYLRSESPGQTLQTTSLVNEAYLRLVGQRSVGWRDRQGFFAAAAISMRRILVDRARSKRARKRGGDASREPMDEAMAAFEERAGDLIELDQALRRLTSLDSRKATIVDIRFFVGLSVDETAAVLNLSSRTVAREWNLARAWLLGELERSQSSEGKGRNGPPNQEE